MNNWYHSNLKLGIAFVLVPPLAIYGIIKRKSNKIGTEVLLIVFGLIYSFTWLIFITGFLYGYFSNLNLY